MNSALASLEQFFAARSPMAIAVSGGVDSMTLAVVACRVNPATEVFHAISPAVPGQATARVERYARQENWQLTVINAGEMEDENYLANPVNRCYFCKSNLYDEVLRHTDLIVASGTNLDDLSDYRPGLVAAEERQVCHPYVEAGIDKAGLRAIAAELGLDDLKDLPAAPCLSSRVTTGIGIDAKLLPLVDEAERGVWRLLDDQLEMTGVRCRILEAAVAIQIESPDPLDLALPAIAEAETWVRDLFARRGYAEQVQRVSVEPYKRGSAFLVDVVEVSV